MKSITKNLETNNWLQIKTYVQFELENSELFSYQSFPLYLSLFLSSCKGLLWALAPGFNEMIALELSSAKLAASFSLVLGKVMLGIQTLFFSSAGKKCTFLLAIWAKLILGSVHVKLISIWSWIVDCTAFTSKMDCKATLKLMCKGSCGWLESTGAGAGAGAISLTYPGSMSAYLQSTSSDLSRQSKSPLQTES